MSTWRPPLSPTLHLSRQARPLLVRHSAPRTQDTRPGTGHPDARGTLKKLGQKLKRGPQIEPYRLCYSFNGLLLITLIHLRSNKACRKRFGSPFLVYVSYFLSFLVWKPTVLASECFVPWSFIGHRVNRGSSDTSINQAKTTVPLSAGRSVAVASRL